MLCVCFWQVFQSLFGHVNKWYCVHHQELDKIYFTSLSLIYLYYKIVCQSKPLMDKSKWLLEQDC